VQNIYSGYSNVMLDIVHFLRFFTHTTLHPFSVSWKGENFVPLRRANIEPWNLYSACKSECIILTSWTCSRHQIFLKGRLKSIFPSLYVMMGRIFSPKSYGYYCHDSGQFQIEFHIGIEYCRIPIENYF
jgi:hypothetical protein